MVLSACSAKNPSNSYGVLYPPTPFITRPADEHYLPTPEMGTPMDAPYMEPSLQTRKSYLETLDEVCEEVGTYQEVHEGQVFDKFILSRATISNMPATALQNLITSLESATSLGAKIEGSWTTRGRKVFVMFAENPASDGPLAEVHGTSLVCKGSTNPGIIIYPAFVEQGLGAQRNTTIHEVGHTFVYENYSLIEGGVAIRVNPVDVLRKDEEGFYELVKPVIDAELSITVVERKFLLEREGLIVDYNEFNNIFEEIMADMFIAVSYMNNDPALNDFYSVPVGLAYPHLVHSLYDTLQIHGLDISPRELAYIFVQNSSRPQSLLEIASILDSYRPSGSEISTLDLLASFSLANNNEGLLGNTFE